MGKAFCISACPQFLFLPLLKGCQTNLVFLAYSDIYGKKLILVRTDSV
jgi:hypothetical protein